MQNEKKVLAAALASRDSFNSINGRIELSDFTEQGKLIWKGLSEFYSRDEKVQSADCGVVNNSINRVLTSDKHRDQIRHILNELGGISSSRDFSSKNIIYDFIAFKCEVIGARLATALAAGHQGPEVDDLIKEYQRWSEAEKLEEVEESAEILHGASLQEIAKSYEIENLIKVWPSSLNARLDGGLIPGHHVVVFARVEIGKTLFLINATAGFLQQGLKVLYIGNEDPIHDIALRVICRLTKTNKYDVLSNISKYDKLARDSGYENLILARLHPGTIVEVDRLVEKYEPTVLIADQLRNFIPSREDNYVQKLEKVASAVRAISGKYECVTLSSTQAADSASGRAILDVGDVDSSNTGIPAQADVMVGIGATEDDKKYGRRILSLPKNKRSGIHESFPVRIDESISRIINL